MSRSLSLWVSVLSLLTQGSASSLAQTFALSLTGFACAFFLGKYHCPVLFTVFTNNTHIVAVRTTGNVYTHEVGSQELCHVSAFRLFSCVAQGSPGLAGLHSESHRRSQEEVCLSCGLQT